VGRRTPPRRLGSRRDRLDTQYSKLTTMQTAAKNLIDQLSAATAVNGDVYVSIVPFARTSTRERATMRNRGSAGNCETRPTETAVNMASAKGLLDTPDLLRAYLGG